MFSHLKRRIGVLAAVAVMAALVPTLAVSTASAAPATVAAAPGDEHTQVACPTGSAAAAGFTDTTSTDVDCIAMFGITLGVTATTYEPSASIPRWQMALYLTRTASIAGHTLGSGADQGFTDISGYSAEIQTAINQLKQLTVTTGTTATTYAPDDNVTREQMAMFVNRLLALTAPGPGGNSDAASTKIVGNAGDSYNYTDIDGGSVTFEGHTAAVSLYNLGVPGHAKTVTTFGPATNMTRGEMATWLNNALDHTNARPAGLSLQFTIRATGDWGNSGPTASVSYRDAAFAPVAGQVVDMFSWANSTTAGNTQFSADGTCNLNTNTAIVGSSLTKCTIDVGDPSTTAAGNIAVGALAASVAAGKTTSFHAWTAAAATKYDNDIHAGLGDTATVNQSNVALPVNITISCDVNSKSGVSTSSNALAHVANVHHGDTVTITGQLTTAPASNVSTPVAMPSSPVTVTHTIYSPNSDTLVASATTSTIYTDATGAASYSFTQADPNVLGTTATTDDVIHSVLMKSKGDLFAEAIPATSVATGPCHSGTPDSVPMVFDFQDTVTDAALKSTMTTNTTGYKAAASALAPVSRTATIAVTDKFGDAITGGNVVFHGGANPVAIKNTAASGNDLVSTSRMTAFGYAANSAICFTGVTTALTGAGELSVGTVHYLKTISAAAESVISFSLTSGGAELTIAGTPTTGEMSIVKAHPVMGCANRTISPQGSASVAWNDTTTTSGMDVVGSTTRHLQAMNTDNAQVAAAITNAVNATKTAYRWLAPSATVLATSASSTLWVEADTATDAKVGGAAADGVANDAADINATPLVVDLAGNTMVVGLNHGLTTNAVTAKALTAVIATGAGLVEVTSADGLFPIGTAVCFTNTTAGDGTGNKLGVAVPGVVYYVRTVTFETSWNDLILATTLSAVGAPTTDLVITGTPTTAALLGYAIQNEAGAWVCSPTTYTSYTWDANDHFYLNSSGGVTTTASSMAGFEGAYVAGVATYGLQGALATSGGVSYANGTLDSVSYQALAANTSIFKLGG